MKRPKRPFTTSDLTVDPAFRAVKVDPDPPARNGQLNVDPSIQTGKLYVDRPVMADGRRLKQARKERGLSVRKLSEEAGVSTSVIYRLEKGRPRECWVQQYNLVELARVLGVEPIILTKT